MRRVGSVGPYVLEYDGSIELDPEVQHTDRPPSFHLSWLPQPGVAFAMHVVVNRAPKDDRAWLPLLDGAQAETASQFTASQIRDIDGTLGAGLTFAARRLAALGGRYQGHAVVVEHYVGRVGGDIIDLVYRLHDAQIDHADSWRLLFHSMVHAAIIRRGYQVHDP